MQPMVACSPLLSGVVSLKRVSSIALVQQFLKGGPHTCIISITWKLAKNADYWASPQTF